MNNSSRKINQNAKEKYTEEVYRTNSNKQNSSVKLSSIFNKNNTNQNGACYNDYKICMKVLNSFNNSDVRHALSVIVENMNINWACQDDNGNTILHHLVLCNDKTKECKIV
jgi:hypothetical protein